MIWIVKLILEKIVFAKIKAALASKAKAATTSATIGVATGLVGVAAWVQLHPEVATAVAGNGWGGVVVACAGVAVAIARARTL